MAEQIKRRILKQLYNNSFSKASFQLAKKCYSSVTICLNFKKTDKSRNKYRCYFEQTGWGQMNQRKDERFQSMELEY